jgi:phosphoribosylglycinamide formyltransferase-1
MTHSAFRVPHSKFAVLISGNGSNLQAILDAGASGELNAQVVAVISNKRDAYGLARAQRANVPAIAKPKPKDLDRRVYDAELADLVASYQPDHAGVMVHLVPDEGVDDGPVLAQEIVPINPDDTLETLEARIHTVEHRLLVDTLNTLTRVTV